MTQSYLNSFSKDKPSILLIAQSIHQLQKASYLMAKIDKKIALIYIRRNERYDIIKKIAPNSCVLDDLDQLKDSIHLFTKIIFFSLYASPQSAKCIEIMDKHGKELFLIQETHSMPTHNGFHVGINFTPDLLFSASDEDKDGLIELGIASEHSGLSDGWMFQSNYFNWLSSKEQHSEIKINSSYLMLLGAPSRIAASAHEDFYNRLNLLSAIEATLKSQNIVLKPHPMEETKEIRKLIKSSKLNLKIWTEHCGINIFNSQNIITSAYSQAAIDFLSMQKDFIMYAFVEENFLTEAFSNKLIFNDLGIRIYKVNSSDEASKNIAKNYLKNEKKALQLFKDRIFQHKQNGNASIRKLEVMLAQHYFRKKVRLKSYLKNNRNNKKLKDFYKIIFELEKLNVLPRIETSYANRLYLYPIILRNLSQIYNLSDQLLSDFLNSYANEKFFQIFLIETLILNNLLGYKKMMTALTAEQSKELDKTLYFIFSKSRLIKYILSLINKIYKIFPKPLTYPLFKLMNVILKLYGNYQLK